MEEEKLTPAIDTIIDAINQILKEDMIDEALQLMEEKYATISTEIEMAIIMNKANLAALQDDIDNAVITVADARVERSRIRIALLNINNKKVPTAIRMAQMVGDLKSIYTSTEEEQLEKIIGANNNLVKIKWLQQGIQSSKSVCQVVRADGAKGTGFVLKGGYLMTNFHVLPTKEKAGSAKIVFDYEEDLLGNSRTTSEFFLDATDYKSSPIQKLDYAYVKIKDNPSNPLSQWGFLETDTFSEPQVGSPVTIIQHPLGQAKQIALTANSIVNVDGRKIFYETDTEKGSSGSPVFNNDWKVIALHHAGKTEEEGGIVVNEATGERRGANEGVLFRNIAQDLGLTNPQG